MPLPSPASHRGMEPRRQGDGHSAGPVTRQLMDGMYNANMPRPVVSETGSSENTMDDILSPVPGAPIRVRDVNAVIPFVTSFDVGKSMTVLEWMTGERESRTGITRLNQGTMPTR
ncbi:portal protein [Sphingomonas sp. MMS24-JH45]